jgi:hypothetical protein
MVDDDNLNRGILQPWRIDPFTVYVFDWYDVSVEVHPQKLE